MTVDRHTQRILHQQLAVARFDRLRELIGPTQRAIKACAKGDITSLDIEALEILSECAKGGILYLPPDDEEAATLAQIATLALVTSIMGAVQP